MNNHNVLRLLLLCFYRQMGTCGHDLGC